MPELGVHEKLELHELLNFKTTCLTKVQTMMPMVIDPNLKTILENDVRSGTEDIQELRNLLI
ncbi:hypothetical protein [Paenibacillus lentus]|uniref:Spore coat protein n=1 Tax=Paenibacillus lentus TaxID=1338368 RepID=A0A3Q8S6A7_9BACL|nr:hypothetical protein [Paenibacillus lentus]AZK48221.1 hypothetical protein EIM92_20265 [Paenibacillus lentus]